MIGRLDPAAPEAFERAMAALAVCADVARAAGSSLAATYVAGAGGNLRHAMTALSGIAVMETERGRQTFDVRRCGESELIGVAGRVDTIRNCRLPDGSLGIVRALLTAGDLERAVWMRPDGRLPGVAVRGTIEKTGQGMAFTDGQQPDGPKPVAPGEDLASDLVRAGVAPGRAYGDVAAWELSLAWGSWVHLDTGVRWFADRATARAVIRLMGAVPILLGEALPRAGLCVDATVLETVEGLGWRHWPTPSLGD